MLWGHRYPPLVASNMVTGNVACCRLMLDPTVACWDRDHALWQTLSDLDVFLEREERWEAGIDTFVDSFPRWFFRSNGQGFTFYFILKGIFLFLRRKTTVYKSVYIPWKKV